MKCFVTWDSNDVVTPLACAPPRQKRKKEAGMLTEIGGTFVKIAWANDPDIHLRRGLPDRPAARFNRVGQDALYLSPDEESARVAIGQYVAVGDAQRVLLTYEVEPCSLMDLRDPKLSDIYELARKPWRHAVRTGRAPSSWHAADRVRGDGHVGLIDPSRRRPGLWHITLFRWNEPGAPNVYRISEPNPIAIEPDCR
ncbi:MAG: RES family NAD+ phosphorylase [Geminicoccaceae bacterium]